MIENIHAAMAALLRARSAVEIGDSEAASSALLSASRSIALTALELDSSRSAPAPLRAREVVEVFCQEVTLW